VAVACGLACVGLLALTAAAGESAAVPGLGTRTAHPPWDGDRAWSPGWVSALLAAAYVLGAAAVGLGLLAVRHGARPRPATVAAAGLVAVGLLAVVPPTGSADHLSYAAYGRIAAAGDDPYVESPGDWRGGRDPVAGAVQPPWERTPSVYGPVATAAQAAVAALGAGSLRLTVWLWQLLVGAGFLLTGWLLDRATRADPAARARAAVLWTLNPLLLGQAVLGAHVDVLAVAAAIAAMAVLDRSVLAAGALVGVAAGIKAPYALAGLALAWGLLRSRRPRAAWPAIAVAGLAALVVLVPAHLWSGPHTYDQLGEASRFVSLATPWRPLVDWLDPVLGRGVTRRGVGVAALALAAALAWGLGRRVRPGPARCSVTGAARSPAAAAMLVLGAAWILSLPYALPWYDVMAWAPLALVAPSLLDAALLARLTVLALAYVPGRVVGLSPGVESLTLGVRREVAPWLLLAVLVAVAGWAWSAGRGVSSGPPRSG
jgi:hypothetical protein